MWRGLSAVVLDYSCSPPFTTKDRLALPRTFLDP